MAKKRVHIVIVSVLLIAMTWLFFNSTFNRHLHALENGQVISHAHPFSKGKTGTHLPFESHHHTESEYLKFDQISNVLFVLTALFMVGTAILNTKFSKQFFANDPLIAQELLDFLPARPPPFTDYRS